MDLKEKSYAGIVKELQEVIRVQFPDSYQDFNNNNSFSFILLNLIAQTSDMLNFYTDYNMKETYLNHAQEKESLIDLANFFGYKVRKNSCSQVEIEFKIVLDSGSYADNFTYEKEFYSGKKKLTLYKSDGTTPYVLPIINSGMKLKTDDGLIQFINDTKTDFSYADEVYEEDGDLIVIKREIFHSGEIKKTIHTVTETTNGYTIEISDPDFAYIEEIKEVDTDNVWKEVNYLAEDEFLDDDNSGDDVALVLKSIKEDFDNRKFITRMNANGDIDIVFGSGDEMTNLVSEALQTSSGISEIMDSNSYGQMPTKDMELEITYITSPNTSSNVASNSITKIEEWTVTDNDGLLDNLEFYNKYAAVFGAGEETEEELRNHIFNHINKQNRIVEKQDFETFLDKLPTKYGKVNKVYVDKYKTDENNNDNTIALYIDVENSNNENILSNIKTWVEHNITTVDNVLVTMPYTVSVAVSFDLLVFGGYNKNTVSLNCISKVKEYFDNLKINSPIIISEIYSNLMTIEGVKSINNIRFENKYDTYKTQGYPKIKYDLNLAKVDNVIYPPTAISIFKIINFETDIKVYS